MKNFIFLLAFIALQMVSGQNSSRIYQKFSHQNNITEISVSDGIYQIKFYDANIVETAFIPNGQSINSGSHAVVISPKPIDRNVKESGNFINIETSGISVRIQKNPFQISYFKNGELLISERNGYGTYEHGDINGHPQNFETLNFNLTPDEVLYGTGARALGMNRRGHRLMLYNRAQYGYETHAELLNFTLPIVVSSKKYMLHFDNSPIGYLDLDSRKDNSLTYETVSGRKIYQVISGNSWDDLVKNYTDLTGKQPMIPRWSLGNFSSRFGYHTQQQTLETIQKFREEKIPVDAVILDLYWFGKEIKGTLGDFEWDKENFPQPQQMIDELRKENVETILITEPFVIDSSTRFKEAIDKDIFAKNDEGKPYLYDFYFGHTGLIDIYSQKGNSWFKNIYKDILHQGVTGIWGDLGEPEVHPSYIRHGNGENGDQVHNIYGSDWAKLVKETFAENLPNSRPFILMRAGYSGAQRNGLVPWSGDVSRNWGGLQSQPDIALQMGMQGIAFMHSDLGGFAGANLDDELYARWLQYGVFNPIYRPHADENVPSEPVYRSEKAKNLAKKSIELRYALLPYNYNLVFENHKNGTPLMRPLFFEEPQNHDLYTYNDTYFWGKDFLISPILKQGQKEKTMYFPKSADWFNFYTDQKIAAGSIRTFTTEEDKIPTFVRAGAIIPMAKPMQSTKEYDGNSLILHYYFDENAKQSELKLYNDDGLQNEAYEKGKYEIMDFSAENLGEKIIFKVKNEVGKDFSAKTKEIELVIHNVMKAPKSVKAGSLDLHHDYDAQKKTLKIGFHWDSSKESKLKVKL